MEKYVKPMVLANEELAEGVYAASGDCYTVNAYISQFPELGRPNYVIHVGATHNAADKHHSSEQMLTLSFNQPVKFIGVSSSNGTLTGGDNTPTLQITFNYHSNGGPEDIGLSDITVEAREGLAITGATLSCDHKCAYNHPIN